MKYLIILSVFIFIFLFQAVSFKSNAAAQDTANCDVCGYCQGVTPVPPYTNPPSDWLKCAQCSYPQLHLQNKSEATSNNTLKTDVLPDSDNHYTVIGCISTKPGVFVSQLTGLFFNVIGGIAFLFLLYGAFLIATSRAEYERLNQGKRIVFGAIVGLLFVLLSTFILRFLAVNVFKIPGFS